MKYSTQHKYQCSEAYEKWKKLPYREQKKIDILLTKSAYKDAYAKGKEEGIKECMERKESYIADIEQQLAGYKEIVAIVLDLNEINETDAIIRDKYGIK